jgi:L-ascorbate metabolism protein UlaG (beta-lactamase superfamily)
MKKSVIIFTLIYILLFAEAGWNAVLPAQSGPQKLEITYVANEGVLIATDNNKILIDALFDNPNPEYTAPPKEMLEGMQSGRAPFSNVNLVLVTHNHPDHFNPDFAARYMVNNRKTKLMAAADAVAAMKDNIPDWASIENRIFSFDLAPGETAEKKIDGIGVKISRTLHSGDLESPHNLMYLIKMDGRTIFHEGDSDGKLATFEGFELEEEKIDLALVHFWFPLHPEAERIIQDILKPNHVGLIHLPKRLESDAPSKIDMVKSRYKDIFLFVKPGEKKVIR